MSELQWTASQRAIFDFRKNTAVSAGAGSGKTAAMVELYLRLLCGEIPGRKAVASSAIAAMTFTEKAAWEMRERIQRGLLARGAADVKNPVIGTIHAFSGQILREFALQAGLDPAFTVLDADESAAVLEGAATTVILGAAGRQDLAVEGLLSTYPLAGTEFSRGLVDHVLALYGQMRAVGTNPAELLVDPTGITRRAYEFLGQQLRDHVDGLVQAVALGGTGKTRERGEHLACVCGHLGAVLPPDEGQLVSVVASIRDAVDGRWTGTGVREAKDRLKETLNQVEGLAHAPRGEEMAVALASLLAHLDAAYRRELELRVCLDFDDLQIRLRDLLREEAAVADELRERYAILMVDEFQDTNRLQWEIVRLLCQPVGSLPGFPPQDGKLFVVGDPKQSIYGFRGAEVDIFRQVVDSNQARTVYLADNFRSGSNIVAFVNGLFSDLMAGDFTENDQLVAHRLAEGPAVEILEPPDPTDADAARLEASVIARRMRELAARGTRWGDMALLLRKFTRLVPVLEELRRMDVPYHVVKGRGFFQTPEIMDLYHLLVILERPSHVIPLAAVLRGPLVSISDEMLFYLFVGDDGRPRPGPEALLQEVPGDALAAMERATREGLSPLTAEQGRRECQRVVWFVQLYQELLALKGAIPVTALLRRALDATALEATLATTFQGDQRIANVRKFLELLWNLETPAIGNLAAVLARLDRSVELEVREPAAQLELEGIDAVKVMTVHQSKGLEFPVVFIGEMGRSVTRVAEAVLFDADLGLAIRPRDPATGRLVHTPHTAALSERLAQRELAESRRLLYVAMTRARDRLVLAGGTRSQGRQENWRAWVDGRSEALGGYLERPEPRPITASDRPPAAPPVSFAREDYLVTVPAVEAPLAGACPLTRADGLPDTALVLARRLLPALHLRVGGAPLPTCLADPDLLAVVTAGLNRLQGEPLWERVRTAGPGAVAFAVPTRVDAGGRDLLDLVVVDAERPAAVALVRGDDPALAVRRACWEQALAQSFPGTRPELLLWDPVAGKPVVATSL
jgi:ATP-dependent helicase/nuclease subunit A